MKVLFNTSVLVAAMIEAHPQHERCLAWLQRARAGKLEFLVAAHTLAELYAVLSSYPARPRLSPAADTGRSLGAGLPREAHDKEPTSAVAAS